MTELTNTLSSLPSIPQFLSAYGPSVLNGLIVVSTISGQSLINKLAFVCPCMFLIFFRTLILGAYPLNEYHSCGFLFGPCCALFLLGYSKNFKIFIEMLLYLKNERQAYFLKKRIHSKFT